MHVAVSPKGTRVILDVFGPTIERLTTATDDPCQLLGTIPPGVSVPLHAHPDFEWFFVVSGSVQVLTERNGGFEWMGARPGDFIRIPGGAKHGFRNATGEPVVQLITTTPRLGRFFEEIGRPVTAGAILPPPTREELRRFAEVAARYGHWLGSPDENAAVGITLPS
jgi:mannose-6-phosphate isomerase-like protein (cupin superfamily)